MTPEGYKDLPPEIVEAGRVPLTGIVHPLTPRVFVWELFLPECESRLWPEETGGATTLARIKEICVRVRMNKQRDSDIVPELARVLKPEKRRLQQRMHQAITAMLDVVYA
jgi:hypothetical protein